MENHDPRDLEHARPRPGPAGRVRAWLGSPPSRAVDVLVFLAVAVPTTGASLATRGDKGPTLTVVLFDLAATLPLLVRRRWPFAVLACVVIAAVLSPASLPYLLPLIVGLYTIGAHRSRKATIAAYCAMLATALAYALAGGTRFGIADVIAIALLGAIAAGTGVYIASKRTSITALESETVRLMRERQLLAERAVAEERVRIAQELHDVIAHNVSLIVVQAQALGATHPDQQVASATDDIADLGRRTMAEMRRTLRLLRTPADAPEFAPQPGLGDLDALLAQSRAAGLPVELAVEGAPRRLAQSVDLSAFRIVQEALTNVVKHAGRARTALTITYGPEALELTIVDSGSSDRGNGARWEPGGHGLIGMRERTALFGGTLTAGPRPGHGFEVHASLPYDERVA
jgi:signal transduction histidine kinase